MFLPEERFSWFPNHAESTVPREKPICRTNPSKTTATQIGRPTFPCVSRIVRTRGRRHSFACLPHILGGLIFDTKKRRLFRQKEGRCLSTNKLRGCFGQTSLRLSLLFCTTQRPMTDFGRCHNLLRTKRPSHAARQATPGMRLWRDRMGPACRSPRIHRPSDRPFRQAKAGAYRQ